ALYILEAEKNTMRRVGEVRLGPRRGVLHLSPDATIAAAVNVDNRLALVSLSDGASLPVPAEFVDMRPRGLSADGHLWLSSGGNSPPAQTQLLRVDVRSGRVFEERAIAPPEPAGVTGIGELQVSRNGEHVVFWSGIAPGRLLIARGLWQAR